MADQRALRPGTPSDPPRVPAPDSATGDDALRRQAALYQALLQAQSDLGDGVVVVEGERFLWANDAAYRITGYSPEELAAIPSFIDLAAPEERARLLDRMRRRLAGESLPERYQATFLHRSGRRIRLDIASKRLPLADRPTAFVLFKDITERQRAEENARFLAEATGLLSASLDLETTLRRVADLAVPHLADICIVDLVAPDGAIRRVAAACADPAKLPAVEALRNRYAPDWGWPHPVVDALRAGRPLLTAEITDAMLAERAKDEGHLEVLRQIGYRSHLVVPIVARGRTVGVLSFLSTDPDRGYSADDVALAEELGRRAAIAIDNATLYHSEQAARRAAERNAQRMSHLQAITAALSGALTPAQVVETVVGQALSVLGALGGGVALLDAGGRHLDLIGAVGFPRQRVEQWRRFPIEAPVPMAHVARTREPLWLRSAAELARSFPNSVHAPPGEERSSAVIPLLAEGSVIGALRFDFAGRSAFDEEDRHFMLALARQCAQALERARLYEAEREARTEVEAAHRRLAFLVEASAILSSSLDYETTLQSVAQLVVPHLADWCILDVLEGEQYRRLAVVHADPAKAPLTEELRRRYPPDPTAPAGVGRVLRTGRSEAHPEIDPALGLAIARNNPELHALLLQLGLTSAMIVPLRLGERTLGALSLASGSRRHRYGRDDLLLAEELAHRAALAVEHATLYRAAQDAIKVRDEFLSVASHELKTPVTSLRGYAQLTLRQLDRAEATRSAPDAGRLRRAIEAIDQQSSRISRLVGQLLDVTRIEAGKLSLEPVVTDLVALVAGVISAVQPTTDLHTIRLRAPAALSAVVDPLRLEQVVTNLLDNAVKYSPSGGAIDVELSQPAPDLARVSVRDRGVGIPEEQRTRIFDRFYQAHAGYHAAGMGLGLYISRQIVELHGGDMRAEFPPDGGTRLVITLPLRPAPPRGDAG